MTRRVLPAIALLMLTSCTVDLGALVTPTAGRSRLPAHIDALCSPVFRETDLVATVISLNTDRDEGITKSAAIEAAGESCSESATQFIAIGDVEDTGFEFTELDGADYEADCTNCLIALIDAIYD